MTTEHSTYTYEGGEQETVTLRRGPATPHGHALLRIDHHDGSDLDCYVNTAWLRDRLDDLGEPRRTESHPLTPDAITKAQQDRARDAVLALLAEQEPRPLFATVKAGKIARAAIRAALTEPPARPEGAERWEDFLIDSLDYQALTDQQIADLADRIAEEMNR